MQAAAAWLARGAPLRVVALEGLEQLRVAPLEAGDPELVAVRVALPEPVVVQLSVGRGAGQVVGGASDATAEDRTGSVTGCAPHKRREVAVLEHFGQDLTLLGGTGGGGGCGGEWRDGRRRRRRSGQGTNDGSHHCLLVPPAAGSPRALRLPSRWTTAEVSATPFVWRRRLLCVRLARGAAGRGPRGRVGTRTIASGLCTMNVRPSGAQVTMWSVAGSLTRFQVLNKKGDTCGARKDAP